MTDLRLELRADCTRCVGICCVAPTFSVSADFPISKPAGVPCPHLAADDRCVVHDRLRPLGFVGCTVFDCLGAGQRVTESYDGRSWRDDPVTAERMFHDLGVLRDLHELRWYLADVLARADTATHHDAARTLDAEVATANEHGDLQQRVDVVLRAASETVRGAVTPRPPSYPRDLVGRRVRDARGADLRGRLLLGADLRGADLRDADLVGADLRGADLGGADLGTALFLTQPQVTAARGDAATRLPDVLARPTHWR